MIQTEWFSVTYYWTFFFQVKSLVVDEPYFSQLDSIKEMTALGVCTGEWKVGKFMRNGDGKLWGTEVPAALLLGFRVASGIEMDNIVLLVLGKAKCRKLKKALNVCLQASEEGSTQRVQ